MLSAPTTAAWGLLFLSVFLGAFTLNAWRPIYRPPVLATVSFFAGWLTCELAAHHLVWQMLVTALLIYKGGLSGWPGLIGIALSGLSWVALYRLHVRGHHSHELASSAFEGSFDEEVSHEGSTDKVRLGHYLRPFSTKRDDVEVHRDIVFAEHGGVTLKLDVFHRKDMPEGAPVMVFVHGGGWIIGFKEYQALPMMNRLSAQGWVCMSIDYRLAPRATFPEPLIDVKAAIAWAKENASTYGGDSSFVAISGNSAGGHLASLAALTWDRPDFQPGFEEKDTRVQACVSFYGVYDLLDRFGHWPNAGIRNLIENTVMKATPEEAPEKFHDLSPISQVRADAPPFMLIHGDRDTLVPVEEARRFTEALTGASRQPVTYMEVPDGQHAFDMFRSVRGHYALRGVAMFLSTLHRRHARAVVVEPPAISASVSEATS